MQHTHTLIIGAGISGLSSAQLLREKGIDTLVLEKCDKAGGLIKCDTVNGHLFHRVGGHVFNTRVEKVADWFWGHFDHNSEFLKARRQAGIFMNDIFLGYPFENYLYKLDETAIRQIVNEIMDLEKGGYRDPFSYDNFEAFLKGNFGETLYHLYFKPYNHKIWKADLAQVAVPWLEGKLPMPNYRDIVLSNILRKEESNMVHSTFYYPQRNGSQFIADRLSQGLQIETNTPALSIETVNGKWVVNGTYSAEQLVYTGDVRQLAGIVKNTPASLAAMLQSVSTLRSNGTSNLLCETDDTSHSWLYLPEAGIPAHRIIYTGNFSANNQPPSGRKSCTVEFSGHTPVAEMEKHIGRLPGNLKMIAHNYEPNSYVIQQKGDREKINALKQSLTPLNFKLVGRFAEWEYHNMDKAIESAMKAVDGIE